MLDDSSALPCPVLPRLLPCAALFLIVLPSMLVPFGADGERDMRGARAHANDIMVGEVSPFPSNLRTSQNNSHGNIKALIAEQPPNTPVILRRNRMSLRQF